MNIKQKYEMRRITMRWVLSFLTAKYIVLMYFVMLFLQYSQYGVAIEGRYYLPSVSFFGQIGFALKYVVWPNIWLFIVAAVVDFVTWPVVFRDEL